ncbi:phage terminase large subunit family protein [Paenibacillus graminis]|uniref:phage terminase large subunit family protein n=1 Tax=Paenibacillus graminis TaxID=189425 RepID=UPI002DBFDAC2|nr:terminase gpA endonuclease subunit [Paenibacillus graminis]MEC0171157.1 phage terminase large subunit family protein [Paenibacillus graminis]
MPKKAESKWPDWLTQAFGVLRPPEKLTVSEWADKYRVLDSKTSAEPGQWSTDRTPYLRGIMDSFTDPRVEEVIFLKPTQVGGTECLNNMLGYIISQDPNPVMVVYPNEKLAQFTSENRLQPMVKLSPALSSRFHENQSKDLELQFDGMYVVVAGAASPAGLSSLPARYLLMDEVDKYPRAIGKEADPRSLARERTRTFPNNRKIMQTSTPTVRSGPIWTAWEKAHAKMQYYVPCPHCGEYQTLIFKKIKFDSTLDPEVIRTAAHYECSHCQGVIRDSHKPAMLRAGEWRTLDGSTKRKRKTGYWLNALYSPWVRFGDAAVEFLTSKRAGAEELQNFVNSWLAEPWENTQVNLSSTKVLEKTSGYDEGVVPDRTILLTAGVDVQKDRMYYSIRAWGEGMTSHNIRHGVVETWAQIEDAMNISYMSRDGTEHFVNLCAVDSGYNADDTYDFCAANPEWAVAVKGNSRPMPAKYRLTKIDREDRGLFGISLYLVDGGYFKDFISGRLSRSPDQAGGWYVYEGCDEEYAEQVTAEHKIKERSGGREVEVWRPKTAHADNHYLDCEVYAAFAADCLGIRYMRYEAPPEPKSETEKQPAKKSWVQRGESWL